MRQYKPQDFIIRKEPGGNTSLLNITQIDAVVQVANSLLPEILADAKREWLAGAPVVYGYGPPDPNGVWTYDDDRNDDGSPTNSHKARLAEIEKL